jgi:stearoyl-CoA desaturase (delta-9 desaturase)
MIDNMVIDVSTFDDHPGGQQILRAYYGKDATKAFHGSIAIHTESAENLLEMYAIATIETLDGKNGSQKEMNEEEKQS